MVFTTLYLVTLPFSHIHSVTFLGIFHLKLEHQDFTLEFKAEIIWRKWNFLDMDLPNIKISLINTEKDIEISHEYGMITDQTIDVYPEEVETAEVESQTEGVIGENIGPYIVGMLL